MNKNDHLYLIDGSSYIFRAYHALPPLTRKFDGLPIGAVSGFCNMLWKLLQHDTEELEPPTHFAVIFDYSSKTFRNEIYSEYKANREEPPEDLRPQFSIIRQATQAFGLPAIEKENFEADDIIATYVEQSKKIGCKVTIFSSDKDLMQLIDKKVVMYDAMKNKRIDKQAVLEKFNVPPEKMIDLQALAGDSSDNVPGVPGIGPKTAAELLEQFGTLENLLKKADSIKQQKRRENLIEFAEQARLSKKLVTLDNKVKLDMKLDELKMIEIEAKELISFLKGLTFNTLTKRIAQELDCDAEQIEAKTIEVENKEQKPKKEKPTKKQAGSNYYELEEFINKKISQAQTSKIERKNYEIIRTLEHLQQWIDIIKQKGVCAFDTESTSLDAMQAELVGISLAVFDDTKNIRACYIPLNHFEGSGDLLGKNVTENQLPMKQVLEKLKPLLESDDVLKVAQNIKYDYLLLSRYDIFVKTFDDTMLLSYVLDAGRTKHNMNDLSEKWLAHKPITFKEIISKSGGDSFANVPIEQAGEYAAEDADITLRLWQVLKPQLAFAGLTEVYEKLEKPLVAILCRMEHHGILIDENILKNLSKELGKQAQKVQKEIFKLGGEEFNIASPKQLGNILFNKLQLPGGKKTKGGQHSTGVQVLEDLANEGHAIAAKIVDWRQLAKLKSTYTDALPEFINSQSGRVHTSYAMASTSTGRLSSSEPNLQNIPIRTNEGRQIRTAFIAEKNHKLLSADYSQIELRLLAFIADIQQLKKAFLNGIDIHALTASEIFGVPLDNIDPTYRRRAKAINFGIIYGISSYGLALQLGISRSEAGEYMDLYFNRFRGIKDYMEATIAFAKQHGFVETIFGRRAHYPELQSKNAQVRGFNERAAINAPIQGSAADLLRRAMIDIEPALLKEKLQAKMLLQVHDELIFEVKNTEVEKLTKIVRNIMENAAMPAVNIDIPLQVDISAAKNWDEAH